jgi:hypothetical protein
MILMLQFSQQSVSTIFCSAHTMLLDRMGCGGDLNARASVVPAVKRGPGPKTGIDCAVTRELEGEGDL